MSMKWMLLVLPLAATGCEGNCQTVEQTGPGLSGTLIYATGDGARVEVPNIDRGSWIETTGPSSISLAGSFDDSFDRSRDYKVSVSALAIGSFDLADRGALCMARQTGGPSICSPLAGTIDVRQLTRDCFVHQSGVGACAETIELTLHATSVWETTVMQIDAEMLTVGDWVESDC
jgi:hypothetical protein